MLLLHHKIQFCLLCDMSHKLISDTETHSSFTPHTHNVSCYVTLTDACRRVLVIDRQCVCVCVWRVCVCATVHGSIDRHLQAPLGCSEALIPSIFPSRVERLPQSNRTALPQHSEAWTLVSDQTSALSTSPHRPDLHVKHVT